MRHTFATTLLVSAVLLSNSNLPAATVTSTADSGPGSLRSALLAASPGDTINFAVTGVITLTSGELLVDKNLIINGPGASNLTIQRSDGVGVPDFRIFNVNFNAGIVSISGLTVKNGRDTVGGGINNSATLSLNDCVIVGNVATSSGGGINNLSTLTASNLVVAGNSVLAPAGSPGFGGGVFSDGTMTALSTTISSNSVAGGSGTNGVGGGVYNNNTMMLTNSTVNHNSATGGAEGFGGGIFNFDSLTIATTTVAFNLASSPSANGAGVGGGIASSPGTVTNDHSTVSGNVAEGGPSGIAQGGGIAGVFATLAFDDSTISGNSARSGGGGVLSIQGSVFLTHSTVTANDSNAIYDSDGFVVIRNTILAGNVGPDLFSNNSSDIQSDGHNLFGSGSVAFPPGPGDRFNLTAPDLRLGPLQDNGGPTFTHALLCGSPAINAGDNTGAPATDQRGFSRIVGGIIDIGSYELTTNALVITCSSTNKTVEIGTAWIFDAPTATDDSTISIVSTVTNIAGHCGTTFDATRVWMATDACSNSASCSQKVTVLDTAAPVITCSNTNKTIEFGTDWRFDVPTATDNSGTNTITIVSTVTNTASHCGTTFDATRVWIATDDCGNSASCSQKVTVVDTTAPVITCSNTNKTIEFGTAWTFDVPTATDNSGTNTITIVSTVTNTASHCGTTFDATRVWIATDACSNSASCSQKVTVVDTTAPVITCSNTNKTVELGTAWTFDIPTATDNSGTNTITIVSTVTNTASHCGTTFDATRVWMATDDCGNSASCSQKVTVVDTTAPVITCSNTNKTVEFGTDWRFDVPTATDNSGTNTITIVSTVTNTASHCGTTFDATRVWIATDDCGNSASCSQKVTVVDTTAPVITCSNTNKTVESGTAWTFDIPTATDNSGTNTITIVSTVTNTASHCGTTFDATRVWMATDDCGNSASCSQKVTVVDTTAPVITCSNTNKTVEFGTDWRFDVPTATDNSGTNTITIVSTLTNTASHCGTTFDATRVWMATDDCGNSASCSQKVTVVDTTAPVITCSNTNKTVEFGTDWRFDVPTATDNSGTNTITIVSTLTNTASHCGTTFDATRVWMATDDCGNSASCSQKVTVVDTTAPVITCSNTNKTVELGAPWTFDVPTATDNSGTNTITIVSTVTNTASHCGTTFDATRVWMATDDCGNSASCSQKVTVVDTTAPVITCSNTNKTVESGTDWRFDVPTATDNSGTNTITIVSTVTNTASHCGTTFDATRVWMATDDCGNSASCSQKVTVVDTTAPVITCSNTNKTVEFGTVWTFDIPTATDNSGTNTITIVSTVTNTASHCGTTFDATRVWMAADACGNSAQCSQKVTVVDTTAPVITCSNTNKTVQFGTAWTFDAPTAIDNSGTNTITIVSTVTNTAGHCGPTFDATRTWQATDLCGNSASCSQKVTVVDTTAPVITCSNTNKTVEFGTAWTFDAPTATDNSGTNTITIVSTVTNTAGHCGNTFDATRTWQAADGCGNSASCSQRVTVANTAPTITCAAPATVCTSSNSAAVSVSVTVTDADGDRLSVIWMVDGVAVQTNQVPGSTPATVALIEFTAVLAQGSHQINVSVSDASGCRASCSSTIGVSSSLGDLYPIALSQKSLAGIAVGGVINDIYNGIKQGNFGWLTWRGSPSEPTLATSLTIPGNSSTYVNPKMPGDHVVSVGDWVQGKPGISNSDQVRKALNALEQIDITVPVWDRAMGRGNNSLYHVVAFARVRILNYHLPHENRITARYLGLAQCD